MSLLPKWRGAAQIHQANMNLNQETISIANYSKARCWPSQMNSKINITKTTNFETLSNELSMLGSKLILESLDKIEKVKKTLFHKMKVWQLTQKDYQSSQE